MTAFALKSCVQCGLCGLALAIAAACPLQAQNVLSNGSFESPDTFGAELTDAGAPWSNFGAPDTRFTTASQSLSGFQSLKTFGPFDFIGSGTGATQKVAAAENAPYQAEIFAQHLSSDPLDGGNFGVFKIEFLDSNMELVAGVDEPAGTPLLGYNFFESDPINADTPLDTWTALDASGFSPPGAAFVQAVLVQVQLGDGQDNFTGGAIFWDDARVTQALAGDYNDDDAVTGADFIVWQRGESPGGGTAVELELWESNLGAGVANAVAATVPEPTAAMLLLMATFAYASSRRGAASRR